MKKSAQLWSLVIAVLLMLSLSDAKSQTLYEMTVSESQGTFQAVNQYYVTNGDDVLGYISMPFTFYWDNQYIYYAYASTNGYLSLNAYNTAYYYYPGYYYGGYMMIAPLYTDLYTYGGVYRATLGSAPNRVLVVTWNNVEYYYRGGQSFYFQVRIYETSNKVEIIYGDGLSSYNHTRSGYAFFAGRRVVYYGPYINIRPGSPSTFYKGTSTGAYINNTYRQYLPPGKTYTLSSYPVLSTAYPAENSVVELGSIYGTGNAYKPGVNIESYGGNVKVYYQIAGPLPETNPFYQVIYTACEEGDITNEAVTISQEGITRFTHAKGVAAPPDPDDNSIGNNGDLDLQTLRTSIKGGQYVVSARMELPDMNYTQPLPDYKFTIALQNDLAIATVISPKSFEDKKYPFGTSRVPIEIRYTNMGTQDITNFETTIRIYQDEELLVEETKEWVADPTPMATAQSATIAFTAFRPRNVEDYRFEVECTLLNAQDEDLSNNVFPAEGEFYFRTAYEIEAEAVVIFEPANEVFVGRPIIPRARFANNGVSDMSDVPAKMTITRLSDNQIVYISNIIVQDIPQGRFNTTDVYYNDNFIPDEPGEYEVCVEINSPDDPITDNNTLCQTFEVVDALSGTYTIGSMYSGNNRNYADIQEALNALYQRGVTDDVIFEFTDSEYTVGDAGNFEIPAIDLSSKIVGVGPDATIKFIPSKAKEIQRASIRFNMIPGSGMGVKFGQNQSPSNFLAAIHSVRPTLVKDYANSAGYITFDGGKNKSFKFIMDTENNFEAMFYLGTGTQNVTVENCIINAVNSSQACSLPMTNYDEANATFLFDKDIRDNGNTTYSSGIVLRNIAPADKSDETTGNEQSINTYNLDTLRIEKNIIKNNEIDGFGYGIVSLGIGILREPGRNLLTRYYNTQNDYSNNVIKNSSRAGMFFGFCENETIQYNLIRGVDGTCSNDAAGIMAGGEYDGQNQGYNNIALKISGNEITDINAEGSVYGIKIEQSRQSLTHNNDLVHFPNVQENMLLSSNAIWGLNSESDYTDRYGIYSFTQRDGDIYTPESLTYFTRNDKFYNNTIIIEDDGFQGSGYLAGIGVQNTTGARVYNNAILIMDNDADNSVNNVNAAFFYQGIEPKLGGISSNRNAFWIEPTAEDEDVYTSAVVRNVQTEDNSTIIELGSWDDFTTLHQWQMWSGSDMISIFSDFSDEFEFVGFEPNYRLRIQSDPTPLGSDLNNRGDRLDEVVYDIDGNLRGVAGQRFDIGAFEFDGRMYISDVEVSATPEPGAYRANSGLFNDAEYIMTEAPCEVVTQLRNNGNLVQNGINVTIKIFMEAPDGSYDMATPVIEKTVKASVQSTETISVDFGLADGDADDFFPETYADLTGYTPAAHFGSMLDNVTPKYKILIKVDADQDNLNNYFEKEVRFYLQRSPIRMVVTSENSMYDAYGNPAPAVDIIAGRLNHDALIQGLAVLGWENDDVLDKHDIDIFDRNGWEPRAVDYSMYRSLFWTDADENVVTRQEILDLEHFLSNGSEADKKNLIIASQEMLRLNTNEDFSAEILRAVNVAPGNPMGASVSNDGNEVIGVTVARDHMQEIAATGAPSDNPPYCGLMQISTIAEGLARVAFTYQNHPAAPENDVMGIATSTIARNVIFLGVDWRHFSEVEFILRGVLDFIEKNGGTIIPVELLSFDAQLAGNRVDITWQTASEYNSDRFDVERSVKGQNNFVKIAEEKAAGLSADKLNYGPITDEDIAFGNTYVYRLRMIDIDGSHQFSNEVEVAVGNADVWLGNAVPSPATDFARFEFSLAQSADIELALYDVNGKKVMDIFSGNLAAGTHQQEINVNKLSSGTYTYALKVGENVFTRQISVVK